VKGGEQAMDQALTIWVRYHVAHVLITVAGEIDITTVPQFPLCQTRLRHRS